eukprot:GFKZ01009880.1.p1 GENE.GFKZ01009880.1~~GFKZ01009880.1.p1  ORF type:complete len:123 (+),score=7.17 GFKZ01009880.1:422-790(+)
MPPPRQPSPNGALCRSCIHALKKQRRRDDLRVLHLIDSGKSADAVSVGASLAMGGLGCRGRCVASVRAEPVCKCVACRRRRRRWGRQRRKSGGGWRGLWRGLTYVVGAGCFRGGGVGGGAGE